MSYVHCPKCGGICREEGFRDHFWMCESCGWRDDQEDDDED